jgi:hypothetical protein
MTKKAEVLAILASMETLVDAILAGYVLSPPAHKEVKGIKGDIVGLRKRANHFCYLLDESND